LTFYNFDAPENSLFSEEIEKELDDAANLLKRLSKETN
jgi:hypothetical protein